MQTQRKEIDSSIHFIETANRQLKWLVTDQFLF